MIFVTSCGYSNYTECMKEEIQKNNGLMNSHIQKYCADQFSKDNEYKGSINSDIVY